MQNVKPTAAFAVWPSLLAGGLSLILYALFAFPAPDWLDCPEFLAAAERLGVFHPPRSPLAVMAAHTLFVWPGEQVDRLALLFSAFCLAGAIALLARSLQRLWRSLGAGPAWLEDAMAACLALSLAFSAGWLEQALRSEVYGLACLIFVAGLHEGLRLALGSSRQDPRLDLRRALRMSALLGMGLAVHAPMVLALLGLLCILWSRPDLAGLWWKPTHLARHIAIGLLGAAPLFLLPLMVQAPVDLRWGDARLLADWTAIISGQAFAPSFSLDLSGAAAALPRYLALLAQAAGLWTLILAMFGLVLLARCRWRLALGLTLALLINAASLLLQRSFRLDNPDVTGYALPALAILTLLVGAGLALASRILERLPITARASVPLVGLACLLAQLSGLSAADRSGCRAGACLAERSLQALPPEAVVICADFNLLFMLDYLQQVQGLRSDVATFYLRDLDKPELRAALPAPLREHLPTGQLDEEALAALARLRPVALDAGPHLDARLARHGRPVGLLWQLDRPISPATSSTLGPGAPWLCADGSRDARSADVLAWHKLWQAHAAWALGSFELARRLLDQARCAAPRDEQIRAAAEATGAAARDFTCPGAEPHPCRERPAPTRRPFLGLSASLMALGLLGWASAGLDLGPAKLRRLRARVPLSCCGLALMLLAILLA